MHSEQKPLYSLTIGEFIALAKDIVNQALKEKEEHGNEPGEKGTDKDEHYNIKELATFLHCSKVSVHNYKKKGLPFYRIGRKILFRKQEVLDFMKKLKGRYVINS